MLRLLFAGFACLISNSAFATICNPTDHGEDVKFCVQQKGNGICNCARTNDPACAVNAFDNCQTWPHDKDKEKKIRDNKNACEDQFPGSTLKNAKLYQGLCVE